MLRKIRAAKATVMRHLQEIALQHPAVAVTELTRHTSRAILNHERAVIANMKTVGVLPSREAESLIHFVEQRIQSLRRNVRHISAPTPEDILTTLAFVKSMPQVWVWWSCWGAPGRNSDEDWDSAQTWSQPHSEGRAFSASTGR